MDAAASFAETSGELTHSFRRRCQAMAKQQKTRFYIISRCLNMLLCWHAHAVSD
ncbi:hypothetical protein KSP40_PGU021100 [Platanthera guangdongensis]|uniref:DEVIL-like protein n=1 Tax=Platanthera guangdongensis TaxID=2320717 RepID=A0ABR2M636_9ASPA